MRFKSFPKSNSSSQNFYGLKKRTAKSFSKQMQSLERDQPESDGLVIDTHTLEDLEIFESAAGGTSLYEMCNFTRTEGGAKILHQRMEQPWSNPDRIRATQESISFIIEQREAFTKLPAYITLSVENYQREILLMVTQENILEFSISAFSIWLNNDRHYCNIVRGVQIVCGVIRALREFLRQAELASPVGELAPIFEEMRELIARPRIKLVPDKEIEGSWPWKILRLDQIFRMHEKLTVLRLLRLIYETDALVSMAKATRKHGFIMPQIKDGPVRVQAECLVHPLVENAVPNAVDIDQKYRVLFLTGPNMAGKTTYLRAFGTALYLGHLGMGVPASSFSFVPAERLFSAISLNDDLHTGISYFRAEALRVKAVAQAISEGFRVVAIMDEPFKGTNVKDAFDASLAILQRFATKEDCLFIFSSHLIELNDQLGGTSQIKKCHFEAQEVEERLSFDYLLHPGVSSQRLGMRVLNEEGVFELLDQEKEQNLKKLRVT